MVINGLLSRVAILTSHIRGLIAPLVNTHEPARAMGEMGLGLGCRV